ncbi:MAG TPA: hypothetical protein VLF89_09675 [Candidatus Saccharimonadales bacterium]|nr:hypothetical protein [Candidatus Saccharimonadales bacterium]
MLKETNPLYTPFLVMQGGEAPHPNRTQELMENQTLHPLYALLVLAQSDLVVGNTQQPVELSTQIYTLMETQALSLISNDQHRQNIQAVDPTIINTWDIISAANFIIENEGIPDQLQRWKVHPLNYHTIREKLLEAKESNIKRKNDARKFHQELAQKLEKLQVMHDVMFAYGEFSLPNPDAIQLDLQKYLATVTPTEYTQPHITPENKTIDPVTPLPERSPDFSENTNTPRTEPLLTDTYLLPLEFDPDNKFLRENVEHTTGPILQMTRIQVSTWVATCERIRKEMVMLVEENPDLAEKIREIAKIRVMKEAINLGTLLTEYS